MRGSPFFDGVGQVDMEIGGYEGKVPVFFYDSAEMAAFFPARYGEVLKLMPDRRFVPARLAPGVGVIAISCLEHRDTDIGPYGELAILVPLEEPPARRSRPGRALWRAARSRRLHAFVLHLPVTSQVALRGGVDLYDFPKFIAEITFDDDGPRRRCRLAEGQEQILRLSGERLRARNGAVRSQVVFHLWMDGQPQLAEFSVNQLETAGGTRPGTVMLELGERHPISHELDRLLLSRRALRYEYVPRLEAILYGPEHLTLPLLTRSLAAIAAAGKHATAA